MQNKLSTKKGFTLIEIVIALAIAALIIVAVLLAVQGAQRSQRNDARRALTDRALAAITDARGNNGGQVPAALGATVNAAISNNEKTLPGVTGVMSIADGAKYANGCGASGQSVIRVGHDPDFASACLEGGTGTGYVSQ